jgi:phosphoribosylformimino-5-aminoimidazole carboxamide ribotide isomerase
LNSQGANTIERGRFTLYPAIDIRGGQCVRLYKGDYNQETVYGSPLDMAEEWAKQGAEWLHVVDLDGAKAGQPLNEALIIEIAQGFSVPVQVGGGIRTMAQVETYLANGVKRVILGTSAIKDPEFTALALKRFGGQIAIGLDARDGYVATEGWLDKSQTKADEVAIRLADQGARLFIFTDISKDGTLAGPNIEAAVHLAQASGVSVIASGGVSSLQDIRNLASRREEGISGAIIGKALYQGVFTLEDALQTVRGNG